LNIKKAWFIGLAVAFLHSGLAKAQQPAAPANPAPGCTSTPAQLEATKKVTLDFDALTGQAKVDLADPSYKQHNPAQIKRGEEDKLNDYDEFKKTFLGGGFPGAGGPANGPQPPQGTRREIVLAQCDIVAIIHKVYRRDPTAEPGKFYESFTFDAYRVKDGKVVEHWDTALINPPAPAGRGQ
jgi:predicted SnoaL-like aldol condensation-catalyzing enzyme